MFSYRSKSGDIAIDSALSVSVFVAGGRECFKKLSQTALLRLLTD